MAGRWVDFDGSKRSEISEHWLLGIPEKSNPKWMKKLGGGFKSFIFLPRKLGKWSNFTNAFPMGWIHQLEKTHRPKRASAFGHHLLPPFLLSEEPLHCSGNCLVDFGWSIHQCCYRQARYSQGSIFLGPMLGGIKLDAHVAGNFSGILLV